MYSSLTNLSAGAFGGATAYHHQPLGIDSVAQHHPPQATGLPRSKSASTALNIQVNSSVVPNAGGAQPTPTKRELIKSLASLILTPNMALLSPQDAIEQVHASLLNAGSFAPQSLDDAIAATAEACQNLHAVRDRLAAQDFGRFARRLEEARDGLIQRRDDLLAHLGPDTEQPSASASDAGTVTTMTASADSGLPSALRQLLAAVLVTRDALNVSSPTSLGLGTPSSRPMLSLTGTVSGKKRRTLVDLTEEVSARHQRLAMALTLRIARESEERARSLRDNLHKLAVATGAPDWENLTVDDGAMLFIQGEKYLNGVGVPKAPEIAFKRYQAAAKCNHPAAFTMLGHLHEHGLGCEASMPHALSSYKRGAALDDPDASHHLGRILERGLGVTADAAAAGEWYLRAAERGHAESMCCLGRLLESGIGRPADPRLAAEWYAMGARGGSARAMNALGSCLYRGVGVEKDASEAVVWFRKAWALGSEHAGNNLGICHEEGRGVVRDLGAAKALYKAAMDRGHASATSNYAYMLMLEGCWCEALRVFHLAWGLGSADAAYNLGAMYESGCDDNDGNPLVPRDEGMAMRWYRDAAGKGSTKAQVRLATMLANMADATEAQLGECVANLRKAAEAGSADAENMLGQMLELGMAGGETEGEDAAPRPAEAVQLYKRGAGKGHGPSLYNLAACFEGGVGVRRDFERAVKIYEEAEKKGSKEARERLDALRSIQDLPSESFDSRSGPTFRTRSLSPSGRKLGGIGDSGKMVSIDGSESRLVLDDY
ncbi:hypothetical protein HK101_006712 [Irineochytrium annulatum]|nr:hypothetical protein HK101_006712 [Irineochytrium annulatum]